jgi:hypothetical protein
MAHAEHGHFKLERVHGTRGFIPFHRRGG